MDNMKTILIVDDNEDNLNILYEFLEDKYELYACLSGKEAFEIIKDNKIDLILLDIMMPEMDGYEVCRQIKENDTLKDIPVIFITSKTNEESIEKAYSVGGVDYISKPFRVVEILSRINNHLELAKQKANLELKIQHEVEKNMQQKMQLFETSKMASMGEMIGNIAHQWRQPLSAISMLLSSIKVQKQVGLLSEEELYKNLDDAISYTEQLSNTVETFRNFIRGEKAIQQIKVSDIINKTLDIISSTLRNHNIRILHNITENQHINITIVPDELTQVVMNIINNAKDALISNTNNSNPWIDIQINEVNESVIISIEDNGGGIPSQILPKIFDPYFTTKHKSQGTGLGLSMSYKIITESIGGKLYVKNSENGAKFFIEIPI